MAPKPTKTLPGCCVKRIANLVGPMNKLSILKEFWEFLKESKKWWLLPIVVFLLMLGVILVAAKGSALAPFIYTLF